MRGNLLLLAMLVGCGGAGKSAAPVVAPPAAPLTPEEVVTAGKGVVEQYRQAYEVRSLDALAAVYSRTVDVVVVHQGKTWVGWTEVEGHLRELLEGAEAIHVRISDVSVVALGPGGAAVSARLEREVSGSVTTVKEDGVLTLALRLERQAAPGTGGAMAEAAAAAERWVIVSEHFSYRPVVP